jgi:hypothetical protein
MNKAAISQLLRISQPRAAVGQSWTRIPKLGTADWAQSDRLSSDVLDDSSDCRLRCFPSSSLRPTLLHQLRQAFPPGSA